MQNLEALGRIGETGSKVYRDRGNFVFRMKLVTLVMLRFYVGKYVLHVLLSRNCGIVHESLVL